MMGDICHLILEALLVHCGSWGLVLPSVTLYHPCTNERVGSRGGKSIDQGPSAAQWKIHATLTSFLPREMWDG